MSNQFFLEYVLSLDGGQKTGVRVYEHSDDTQMVVAPGRAMQPIWNRGDDLHLGRTCPRTVEFRVPRKDKRAFYKHFQTVFRNRLIKSDHRPIHVTMGKLKKSANSQFLNPGNAADALANASDAAHGAGSVAASVGTGVAVGAVTLGAGLVLAGSCSAPGS